MERLGDDLFPLVKGARGIIPLAVLYMWGEGILILKRL